MLIQHPELIYFKPFAWSPDGKAILTLIWKKDLTTQIAWVSSVDGRFKTLKSLEWRDPEKISLSPDGRFIAYDALERRDSPDREIFILAADGSSEATAVSSPGIHNNPVWAPDGAHLIFTSDRSRNFGLYALGIQAGKPQGVPQLLKPDVGRVTLCGFVRSGALYYLQQTGDQNVYLAELDPATGKLRGTPAPLASTYSGMNSRSALSPDGKFLAYLSSRTGTGVFSGSAGPGTFTVIVKSLATQVERAFPTSLDLTGAPSWFADGRTLLLGARSQPQGPGRNFFRLDLDSGAITKVNTMPNHAAGQQWVMSPDGEPVYTTGRDTDTDTTGVVRLLAANTRFLILPWVRVPHLASHLLGRMAARLSADWEQIYHHPIVWLETFIDPARFRGTCYRAANWIVLGRTAGRGHRAPTRQPTRPIKEVLGHPLVPDFRRRLCEG